MKNIRKSKHGFALITVIFVLVVSSLFITAVLTLMMSDNSFSNYQEKRTQAQYIARAGADAAAEYVQDHSTDYGPSFTTQTIPSTIFGEGTYSVTITQPFTGSIVVESIGVIDDIQEVVTVSLVKGNYSSLFKGMWQTGFGPFEATAMEIYPDGNLVEIEGNVETLDDIELNPDYVDDPLIKKSINLTSPGEISIPDDIVFDGDYNDDDPDNVIITGSMDLSDEHQDIETDNNQTLVFDTEDTDQYIIVDRIELDGPGASVEITGSGTVHLFVQEYGSIDNPINVNTGEPSKLFIYLADGIVLDLHANCTLDGYIYGPNATVKINSDDSTVYGAMIAQIYVKNSQNGAHGVLHYVPLDDGTDYSGLLYYAREFFSN